MEVPNDSIVSLRCNRLLSSEYYASAIYLHREIEVAELQPLLRCLEEEGYETTLRPVSWAAHGGKVLSYTRVEVDRKNLYWLVRTFAEMAEECQVFTYVGRSSFYEKPQPVAEVEGTEDDFGFDSYKLDPLVRELREVKEEAFQRRRVFGELAKVLKGMRR